MHYFGGKFRISKDLGQFFNEKLREKESKEQVFVDLFCGSLNITKEIDSKYKRIANDKHHYLIEMWKNMQIGWIPPEFISEDEYRNIREYKDENKALTGFVGFGCSFAGKWFGGYARCKTYNRNYAQEAKNSNIKIINSCKDVIFYNLDYKDVNIPDGSVVYCDIPYKNKTQYSVKECGKFSHEEFYEWVDNNKDRIDIYISEYKENVPDGFDIIWEKKSRTEVRNKDNQRARTTEVLITPKRNISKEQ